MNKNTGIIIGIVALVVIVGGVYASMNLQKEEVVSQNNTEQANVDQKNMEDKQNKDETIKDEMVKDEAGMTDKKDSMMKVGSYEAYSSEKLAMAATGDVVLFFHASWCPSCRGLNSDIEKNLNSIPAGVTILKADYDKETELKKKYGVSYQHTLVQVDKDGNMIKKWSGGSNLESILSQIQ